MSNTQKIDVDGDGNPDIEVKGLKPKKAAQPKVVEGTELPKDGDSLNEFNSQKASVHLKIILPSTNDPNEVKRVFVGVNGVPYTLVRDYPHIVPKCVVEALNNARETRYRDGPKGPLGNITKVPYPALSYPFQVLGEVPADQVEVERAKVVEEFGEYVTQ